MIGPSEAERRALERHRRTAGQYVAAAATFGAITVITPVAFPPVWAAIIDAFAVLIAMGLAFFAGSYSERGIG
jgi:VIT1/CCC1 family predicted Fe2+/Mn2+ transporter